MNGLNNSSLNNSVVHSNSKMKFFKNNCTIFCIVNDD